MKIPTMSKTRKMLVVALVVTLVLAIASVIAATQLGIFFGGEVNTNTVEGSILYSEKNSTTATWKPILTNIPAGGEWYARFNITGNGYAGPVTLTWVLQEKVLGTWTDTAFQLITTFTLSGTPQIIYASANGLIATNKDWGSHTTTASTWRIAVDVKTA